MMISTINNETRGNININDTREKQIGMSWRKITVNNHHFSRTKRCIIGINQFTKENKVTQMEAVETLEGI